MFQWWLQVAVWSLQTLNLEVFKTELENVFVFISITLCADSVIG